MGSGPHNPTQFYLEYPPPPPGGAWPGFETRCPVRPDVLPARDKSITGRTVVGRCHGFLSWDISQAQCNQTRQQESGNEKNHNKQRWLRVRWKVRLKVRVFSFYSDFSYIFNTHLQIFTSITTIPVLIHKRKFLTAFVSIIHFTVVTSGNKLIPSSVFTCYERSRLFGDVFCKSNMNMIHFAAKL